VEHICSSPTRVRIYWRHVRIYLLEFLKFFLCRRYGLPIPLGNVYVTLRAPTCSSVYGIVQSMFEIESWRRHLTMKILLSFWIY